MRQNGNSFAFATGTSGHRWLEAESYDRKDLSNIDISYHESLVEDAIKSMSKYGDVEWFLSDDVSPEPLPDFINIPCLPKGMTVEEIPFK